MRAGIIKRYKHLWLIVLFVSLVTAAAWGGTTAYLTDQKNIVNEIVVGDNVIAVREVFEAPDPGLSELFKKEIRVENTGNCGCFVRVCLAFSNDEIAERSFVSSDGGENFLPLNELPGNSPEHWIYVPENEAGSLLGSYWYYTEKLEPGELTGCLTTDFRITFESEHIREKLAENGYDIYVYAESVQVLDKDGREWTGDTAWQDAWTEMLERK